MMHKQYLIISLLTPAMAKPYGGDIEMLGVRPSLRPSQSLLAPIYKIFFQDGLVMAYMVSVMSVIGRHHHPRY